MSALELQLFCICVRQICSAGLFKDMPVSITAVSGFRRSTDSRRMQNAYYVVSGQIILFLLSLQMYFGVRKQIIIDVRVKQNERGHERETHGPSLLFRVAIIRP